MDRILHRKVREIPDRKRNIVEPLKTNTESMKVKELIKILQKIDNQDRHIQILVGDEDKDNFASDNFEVMHTDDVEQCVEIFIEDKNIYQI